MTSHVLWPQGLFLFAWLFKLTFWKTLSSSLARLCRSPVRKLFFTDTTWWLVQVRNACVKTHRPQHPPHSNRLFSSSRNKIEQKKNVCKKLQNLFCSLGLKKEVSLSFVHHTQLSALLHALIQQRGHNSQTSFATIFWVFLLYNKEGSFNPASSQTLHPFFLSAGHKI